MEGKPLSKTNRVLARALAQSVPSNLLLTTNFDDQIERALNRLGVAPAAIDLPEAVERRIDLEAGRSQIVYLHGKFVFTDLAQSGEESTVRNLPMLRWLSGLMLQRSPLVVGYSGEMEDFFIVALRKALSIRRTAALPAFWFCFDPSSASKVLADFDYHPGLRVVAGEGKLQAFDVISALTSAVSPDFPAEPRFWKVPHLETDPSAQQCEAFQNFAASLYIGDLEDGELAALVDDLLASSTQITGDSLDKATTRALETAQELFKRNPLSQQARLLLAGSLVTGAYCFYEQKRYRESLALFDSLEAKFGNETDPLFVYQLVQTYFYRSVVLDCLGRAEEAEVQERECLRFMQDGSGPEVLGYAMMTASNLANRLVRKNSDDSRAEAGRLRDGIHGVYPGPANSGCVEANYRSWNALGVEHWQSKNFNASLDAFDKTLSGQRDLFASGLGEIAFGAMKMRSRILFYEKRYSELSGQLSEIGKLFGSPRQRELTIEFGKLKIKEMGMGGALGMLAPDAFTFPAVLWEGARTQKDQARLVRASLMLIDCYLHRHEYAECIDAAEELFSNVGQNPVFAAVKGDVVSAHYGVLCARAGLVCQALKRGDDNAVREQASAILHDTARVRGGQSDTTSFLRAYSHYLLGDLSAAKADALECGRVANRARRCQLLAMIEEEPPNDY
jgi:tetratricopeptide (TPR) repeat protein